MARSHRRFYGQSVRHAQGDAPRATKPTTGRQITLSCGHSTIFKGSVLAIPSVGDEIYCRRCEAAVMVFAAQDEISVRCTECRYIRPFGQAMVTAETAASVHAIKKNHTVAIYDGATLLRKIHEHVGQQRLL
jgi:hypothetical protein